MSALIRDIEALPREEQLPYALELIARLTCAETHQMALLSAAFGLSKYPTQVLGYLANMAPVICSREMIFQAVWGPESDTDIKTLDVHICKIRAHPDLEIETFYGRGYRLSPAAVLAVRRVTDQACPGPHLPPAGRAGGAPAVHLSRWTPEDDAELLRMRANGSDWWAIADELGRTERACVDRAVSLGVRTKSAACRRGLV